MATTWGNIYEVFTEVNSTRSFTLNDLQVFWYTGSEFNIPRPQIKGIDGKRNKELEKKLFTR